MKNITQWIAVAAVGLIVMASANAQEFEEGTHYTIINDMPKRTGSIEVEEIFSYSCGHCYSFEPMIEQYKEHLLEGVKFKQIHIKWDKPTENLSRAFYTAKALKSEAANEKMFSSIHVDRKRVVSPEEIEAVFVEAGIDADTFNKTFNSFGVTGQVKRAEKLVREYRIDSTPQLVVNGQYKIQPKTNVSQKQMLEIVDYLIAKIKAGEG